MRDYARRWGPAVVIMSLIFIASSTPGTELPSFGFGDTLVKKSGHMIGYALLAVSYLHAINGRGGIGSIRFVIAFCLTILYAASDEWHQGFTSGRTPSFLDVVIDGAGGFIGLLLWHAIRAKSFARRKAD